MDPEISFYQALAGVSFTLLGLWFTALQLVPDHWRTDPRRHRANLHTALHFLLPGTASLASVLADGTPDGLIWRATFLAAGLIGLAEAVSFVRRSTRSDALSSRILRGVDPVLYAAMGAVAFAPQDTFALTPLQLAGMVTGGVFLVGLCFVWLAFAEPRDGRAPTQPPAAHRAPVPSRPEPT
ncbi:hypothetical protein [Geodermatophilus normandii]|uniref:hypothetical protein n=1 Tax=Geodermatophilus normandii TaxID=1137989 RepID=UPI000D70D251|nr:hypothetical protein [Geodermatophilus normandii]